MTRVITTIMNHCGRGGRRSDYAGATAPVRLGARRHHSAHGAQIQKMQPIRLITASMPIGE